MTGSDEPRQEIAALRERNARLHAAILRIGARLDLDTALRQIVDSARALTGARYGMIATVDDAGEIEEFIASGLLDDERRRMAERPHGYAFFQHLRDVQTAAGHPEGRSEAKIPRSGLTRRRPRDTPAGFPRSVANAHRKAR